MPITPTELEKLLLRYYDKRLSASEIQTLLGALHKEEHQTRIAQFLQTQYRLELQAAHENPQGILSGVMKAIQQQQKQQTRLRYATLSLAACALLWIGIRVPTAEVLHSPAPHADPNPIVLEWDTGASEILDPARTTVEDAQGQTVATRAEDNLIYSKQSSSTAYNRIQVPKGKELHLQLSDGSRVHLNAESSLRFPIHFSLKNPRRVQCTGEAFFEVNPNHPQPFVVEGKNLQAEVLGTRFNFRNLPDDLFQEVALVEGRVRVSLKKQASESVLLEARQQASFRWGSASLTKSYINPNHVTAWRRGEIFFRNQSLTEILKELERVYGVRLELMDPEWETGNFVASLNYKKKNSHIYWTISHGYRIWFMSKRTPIPTRFLMVKNAVRPLLSTTTNLQYDTPPFCFETIVLGLYPEYNDPLLAPFCPIELGPAKRSKSSCCFSPKTSPFDAFYRCHRGPNQLPLHL